MAKYLHSEIKPKTAAKQAEKKQGLFGNSPFIFYCGGFIVKAD